MTDQERRGHALHVVLHRSTFGNWIPQRESARMTIQTSDARSQTRCQLHHCTPSVADRTTQLTRVPPSLREYDLATSITSHRCEMVGKRTQNQGSPLLRSRVNLGDHPAARLPRVLSQLKPQQLCTTCPTDAGTLGVTPFYRIEARRSWSIAGAT